MALRRPTTLLTSSTPLFSTRTPFVCASCTLRHARSATTDATDSPVESTLSPAQAARVPKPTPFVPDPQTFLTLIGRSLSSHANKFSSWEELFTLSSAQMKAKGLDPPRTRKYLLRWREKFRRGDYGIGGDLKYVKDGIAELRVVDVPSLAAKTNAGTSQTQGVAQEEAFASTSRTPGFTKLVLNVPIGMKTYKLEQGQSTKDLKKPQGVTLKEGHIIAGSYVMPMKGSDGSAAMIKVTEGMWEDRRGHKVHGGERRRAETLHKMRVAESRKARR